jgi:P-type Cu+ transporter
MMERDNSVLYGLLAGLGLLVFYLGVVSIFQGIEFAFLNLRGMWYLILPLAAGFGTQIGLYSSIRHSALLNSQVGVSGGVAGGSMIACCSHFLLNIIPLAGASGLALFLARYQAAFLGVGILANVLGIGLMIRHKRRMEGGSCHNE